MPTYEYKCEKCGYRFEEFQSITEAPIEVCPECRGKVKRIIGAGAGIIFKGKGFYQTDYKGGAKKGEDKPSSCPGSCDCPCKE